MDWQQMVTLSIVGATALAFLLARVRRKQRVNSGCVGGCGCADTATSRRQPGMIYRGRKGERPEIVMRSS